MCVCIGSEEGSGRGRIGCAATFTAHAPVHAIYHAAGTIIVALHNPIPPASPFLTQRIAPALKQHPSAPPLSSEVLCAPGTFSQRLAAPICSLSPLRLSALSLLFELADLPLSNRLGSYVADEDLGELLQQARVFIVPIRWATGLLTRVERSSRALYDGSQQTLAHMHVQHGWAHGHVHVRPRSHVCSFSHTCPSQASSHDSGPKQDGQLAWHRSQLPVSTFE